MFAVIAWTGCRRGEACGLRWDDVELNDRSLLIHRAVIAIPGGVEVKGTKTGELRRIAIGTQTVKLLKAHRRRCESRAALFGVTVKDSAYIFSPDPAGCRPYNPFTITRTFVSRARQRRFPQSGSTT